MDFKWSNEDPRQYIGKYARIVIIRPVLGGWRSFTAMVDVKNSYSISFDDFTPGERSCFFEDDKWDADWCWAFMPLRT